MTCATWIQLMQTKVCVIWWQILLAVGEKNQLIVTLSCSTLMWDIFTEWQMRVCYFLQDEFCYFYQHQQYEWLRSMYAFHPDTNSACHMHLGFRLSLVGQCSSRHWCTRCFACTSDHYGWLTISHKYGLDALTTRWCKVNLWHTSPLTSPPIQTENTTKSKTLQVYKIRVKGTAVLWIAHMSFGVSWIQTFDQ